MTSTDFISLTDGVSCLCLGLPWFLNSKIQILCHYNAEYTSTAQSLEIFVSEHANFHLFLSSSVNLFSPVREKSKGGDRAPPENSLLVSFTHIHAPALLKSTEATSFGHILLLACLPLANHYLQDRS